MWTPIGHELIDISNFYWFSIEQPEEGGDFIIRGYRTGKDPALSMSQDLAGFDSLDRAREEMEVIVDSIHLYMMKAKENDVPLPALQWLRTATGLIHVGDAERIFIQELDEDTDFPQSNETLGPGWYIRVLNKPVALPDPLMTMRDGYPTYVQKFDKQVDAAKALSQVAEAIADPGRVIADVSTLYYPATEGT